MDIKKQTHAKPVEVFTSIDLELAQPSGKIIQIGAIVGNIATGEILDRLSVFINPNEELSPFIKQLTKITQEEVDNGVTLEEGYTQLRALHLKHKSFCNFLQWGQGDTKCIRDQLKSENPDFKIDIGGRRDIDAKTIYVAWRLANGKPPVGGLSRAMKNLGLQFKGQAHNALWDAENTFTIYCKLLQLLKGTT